MKNIEEVIESANNCDDGHVAYLCNDKKMVVFPVVNKTFFTNGFILEISSEYKMFFDSNPTYVVVTVWNKTTEIQAKGKMVYWKIEDKHIENLNDKMHKESVEIRKVEIMYFELIEDYNVAPRKCVGKQIYVTDIQ